ncbi:MAG: VTT domain-containing protein [Acidobacteriota bacterium]|nr:VTT domain-containing protein [Acidobacteriota bacterium]
MKLHPIALLHKFSVGLLLVFKPLGVWGVGGLALIDSALIPIPISMDGIIIGYVAANPRKFVPYCLIAALAAAVGSLVPFYIGRAGGELVLLKRINRERYERMRDRFERQEFLAILIPSMLPPPTPLKLFQFGAGVFEMKPVPFVLATFCGKLTQFTVASLATIWFGPTIAHTATRAIHKHANIAFSIAGFLLLLLALYVARRIFDARKGVVLPLEEVQGTGNRE